MWCPSFLAKLIYNSVNYGLWILELYIIGWVIVAGGTTGRLAVCSCGLGGVGGGWGGGGGRNYVPFAAFAWTFCFCSYFYVTLARCLIILHATRHATLARCRIILHATRHATLARCRIILHATRHATLARCRIILHATRHATLARCRIILHAARHATLARCRIILHAGVGGVGGGRNYVPFAAFAWTFCFCSYFYVTLARCLIILHATRHATLARCRIILHATRHATLARCRIILHATRHATLVWGGGVITFRVLRSAVPFRFSPSLLFSCSYVLWSSQHNSVYVCLGAMVTWIFLVSYNFTCPRLVGWCWKILFLGNHDRCCTAGVVLSWDGCDNARLQ